jgi:flagellar assembly FlgT-like protein
MRSIFLLTCILCLVAPLHAADDDQVINAEGIATMEKGGVAAARDRAIDDALRKAVEQAVGTFIESETIVQNYQILNDSVYAQTKGFVRTYKVVSEKQDGPLYRVTVAATVAVGDVKADLQSLGLLIQRMRKPRVMVMIPEENFHDTGWWLGWAGNVGTVETMVIKALKQKEFTVLDSVAARKSIDKEAALKALEGDTAAAARIALQTGAEVLITGQAVSQPAGSVAGSQMHSYQASVTARAIKADTGEILATSTGEGKAVHLNATAGGNEALKQAGSMVAGDLIGQISAQWAKEASGTRMVALSVTGISKSEADNLIGELKSGARGVAEAFLREYAEGVARLDVDFKGDAETLSRELAGLALAGGRLEVTATTPNKVNVRFVPAVK